MQLCRMYLTALSKILRTKNSNRNRYHNHKLHYFNVKPFYSKLRCGDSGGISNPPPDDAVKNYWGGLLVDKAEHNKELQWIKE